MSVNFVDYNMQSIFQEELMPDENILWAGQSDPDSIFRKEDVFAIPFGIFFLGFAIFWTVSVFIATRHIPKDQNFPIPIGSLFSTIFPLFGVPFILVGIYLLFGRIIIRRIKQKHVYYAVTNKRIVIMKIFRGKELTSLSLDSLIDFQKTVGRNGIGSISFNTSNSTYSNNFFGTFNNFSFNRVTTPYSFEAIRDVDNVYDIISRQKAATHGKQ